MLGKDDEFSIIYQAINELNYKLNKQHYPIEILYNEGDFDTNGALKCFVNVYSYYVEIDKYSMTDDFVAFVEQEIGEYAIEYHWSRDNTRFTIKSVNN